MNRFVNLGLAVLASFVLSMEAAAIAVAATVWVPTDVTSSGPGDVNIIQIGSIDLNGGSLFLFEDTDFGMSNGLELGSIGGDFQFAFNTGTGLYDVTTVGGDNAGASISISGFEFNLAVTWDSGTTYHYDTNRTQQTNPTTYLIEFSDYTGTNTGESLGVDLQPIPIPAAAWLFGSALLGLAGIARRRRT